jgi:hypothetical protein
MRDFFTRLAERTLGVEPVARPDIPPLIGSAPERDSVPPSEPESGLASISAKGGTEPRIFDRSDKSWRLEKPHGPLEGRHQRASAEQQVFDNEPPRASALVSLEPGDNSSADDGVGERRTQFWKNPVATEVATLFARREPVIAPPKPQRIPLSEPRAFESSAAAPPAIHVSIGRVEVRAVTAPYRPNAPERRASARLSLEQYLRERNEGRR